MVVCPGLFKAEPFSECGRNGVGWLDVGEVMAFRFAGRGAKAKERDSKGQPTAGQYKAGNKTAARLRTQPFH